jgi:hypothetical protein
MSKVTNIEELVGKTIFDYHLDREDLYLRFTDETFVKIKIFDITEGFGHEKLKIDLCDYSEVDKTDEVLRDLGIISQEEYEEAIKLEKQQYQKRQEEREKQHQEELKKRELQEYQRLKEKLNI